MFLINLYQHSKALFAFVVLFLLAFIFLNLKWGAVATPVYQFGMFSGVMNKTDTQKIYALQVNDKPLNMSRLHFVQRDKLTVALQQYSVEMEKNKATFETMQRILSKIGIGKYMHASKYSNQTGDAKFTRWYQDLIASILKTQVTTIQASVLNYLWKEGLLQPVSPPQKILFLAD